MKSGNSSVSAIALLAAAIAVFAAPARASFTVRPANVYADLVGGAHHVVTITVQGPESTAYDFVPDAFTMDADGRPHRGDHTERSCLEWTRVSRGAGSSAEISIEVPQSAVGSYWCAVVVRERGVASERRRATVSVVVPIFITIRGTEERALSILSLQGSAGANEIVVVALLRNDGNSILSSRVSAAIEEPGNAEPIEIASADERVVLLLPGSSRVVTLRFAFQERGDVLTATLFVRYGVSPEDSRFKTCPVTFRTGNSNL